MWIIISSLIALILGSLGSYFILKPELNKTQTINTDIVEQNKKLQAENEDLIKIKEQYVDDLYILQNRKIKLHTELKMIKDNIASSKEMADEAANNFYQQSMLLAQTNLEHSLEQEALKYQEAIKSYEEELSTIMKDNALTFIEQSAEYATEITELKNKIKDLKTTTAAAVEAAKRAEEMKDSVNFYRIQLSDLDLSEIEMLRSISPYLRDKDPLNKIIWKYYYEKPTNDMIGRVIGAGIHTGIYKITHIESGRCYVGQAANLTDRWKQHIKRGVGADPPTRNKLYPAMIEFGPENFTFEVIEECTRDLLDEREDYWQDYFKAKEFGYSIK